MYILILQLEEMRKNEDPRLSFSTPEFKEAQRIFTDAFKVRCIILCLVVHCTQTRALLCIQFTHLINNFQPFVFSQKNFGKPVEWALVKDYAWSTPQLRKLDKPVDVDGNPWPLDANGNPILK